MFSADSVIKRDNFITIHQDVIPRPFLLPSFSIFDVLCDPTDFILREETPFEAMTGRTALIDDLLAEVFRAFPQLQGKYQEIYALPLVSVHYHTCH